MTVLPHFARGVALLCESAVHHNPNSGKDADPHDKNISLVSPTQRSVSVLASDDFNKGGEGIKAPYAEPRYDFVGSVEGWKEGYHG